MENLDVTAILTSVSSGLMLFFFKELYSMKSYIQKELKSHAQKISEQIDKQVEEGRLVARQTNEQDAVISELTETTFNSRNVAEGKQTRPRIHPRIRKITLETRGAEDAVEN